MKEKKSNIKNSNYTIEDEQKELSNRLVGLFLIVYSILCFTQSGLGCIFRLPLTFLVGSFTPIALLIVIIIGGNLLIFKRISRRFSVIQYVLLSLIVLFSLTLATATIDNRLMTFSTCFGKYLGKDGVFSWRLPILSSPDGDIRILGGGIIGYMLYGLINSITSTNYTITIVVSAIILGGSIFILIAPTIARFIKWCKKIHGKKVAKRAEKKKAKEEKLLANKNNDPVGFDLSKGNEEKSIDSLLEPQEIKITGDNYSYSAKANTKQKKLERLMNSFDEEIYSDSIKNPSLNKTTFTETKEVRLTDAYSDDFASIENNKEEVKIEQTAEVIMKKNINDILNEKVSEESQVQISANIVEEEVKIDKFDVTTNSLVEKNTSQKTIYPEVNKEVKDVNVYLANENRKLDEIKIENPIKEEENVLPKEETKIEDVPTVFDESKYELPPLYLLKEPKDNGANAQNEEIAKEKAEILMEKMRELNVSASINAFVVGPSVTRFEIALAPGVRVGSFTNLQEDFKLALGVNSIRIESPIPGKSAIGIEIPNAYRAMVSMKEIITRMPNKKHKLYVPIGKDITGTPLSFPICDMPHCLISGATNSGKSVCANTIILSLLMNYKPNEVRLIMVDPKRVEMLFYKDIPHLLCPIITDSEKARVALDKLCVEMDKRFTIFSKVGVKNIASYNEYMVNNGKPKMSFIILVVDEFAELMLCKSRNIVEEKIQKLAQLGRAAGIHLILATQRPDVNVIPGTIKTNLPCRMTFRLSSLADSRTVIDVGGAEKLLNNGDMLLLSPDFTGLRRVQGVYVSDTEISDVVEYCKKQCAPQYDEEFLDLRTDEQKEKDEKLKFALDGNSSSNDEESSDALYEDIKNFVIKEQKASTSFLQRKFSIGYAKAARYIDMLEEEGIIGPENGSKPREVLISSEDEFFDEES